MYKIAAKDTAASYNPPLKCFYALFYGPFTVIVLKDKVPLGHFNFRFILAVPPNMALRGCQHLLGLFFWMSLWPGLCYLYFMLFFSGIHTCLLSLSLSPPLFFSRFWDHLSTRIAYLDFIVTVKEQLNGHWMTWSTHESASTAERASKIVGLGLL